jgi:hypothetical protein
LSKSQWQEHFKSTLPGGGTKRSRIGAPKSET